MTDATIRTERPIDRLIVLDCVGGPADNGLVTIKANAVGYKCWAVVGGHGGYHQYAKVSDSVGFWLQYVGFERLPDPDSMEATSE